MKTVDQPGIARLVNPTGYENRSGRSALMRVASENPVTEEHARYERIHVSLEITAPGNVKSRVDVRHGQCVDLIIPDKTRVQFWSEVPDNVAYRNQYCFKFSDTNTFHVTVQFPTDINLVAGAPVPTL